MLLSLTNPDVYATMISRARARACRRVGAGARDRAPICRSVSPPSLPFFTASSLPPSLSLSLPLPRSFRLSLSLSISFAYSLSCASVERYRVPLRGLVGVRVGGSRSRARIAGGRAMRGGRARTEPSDGAPRSFMNGPRRLSHIWKRRVDCQPIPALRSPINARLCPCRVYSRPRMCGRTHAPLPPPRGLHVVTASHCSQASLPPPRRPSRAPTFP